MDDLGHNFKRYLSQKSFKIFSYKYFLNPDPGIIYRHFICINCGLIFLTKKNSYEKYYISINGYIKELELTCDEQIIKNLIE